MTLLQTLLPELACFLAQRGCVIIEERCDPAFGNVLSVVECDGFLVRVVKDRGHTTIEVGQRGEQQQWHTIENVLEFLKGALPANAELGLKADFGQVSDLMKSDLDQRGYVAFERKKAEAVSQRLFPNR